jgi:hypothetical protein
MPPRFCTLVPISMYVANICVEAVPTSLPSADRYRARPCKFQAKSGIPGENRVPQSEGVAPANRRGALLFPHKR